MSIAANIVVLGLVVIVLALVFVRIREQKKLSKSATLLMDSHEQFGRTLDRLSGVIGNLDSNRQVQAYETASRAPSRPDYFIARRHNPRLCAYVHDRLQAQSMQWNRHTPIPYHADLELEYSLGDCWGDEWRSANSAESDTAVVMFGHAKPQGRG